MNMKSKISNFPLGRLYKKAYIDPGTGAMILSQLWIILVTVFGTAVAFLVKYFWKPIKKFFGGKK